MMLDEATQDPHTHIHYVEKAGKETTTGGGVRICGGEKLGIMHVCLSCSIS